MARNIRAIDRTALRDDLQDCLSGLQSLSAMDFDSHLRCVLDKHAPATRRKVPSRRSAPWFKAVSEKVGAAKQQRRCAERQWLKTGLTIHKQIYNRAKKCVTRLVHAAKTSYFCSMIRDSLSCKQLFRVTNQLLESKKTSPLPIVFSLIELPQRFLEFFHRKVQTIRNNFDCQASLPPSCSKSCFHGRPLRNFKPVNEDL